MEVALRYSPTLSSLPKITGYKSRNIAVLRVGTVKDNLIPEAIVSHNKQGKKAFGHSAARLFKDKLNRLKCFRILEF